MSCCKPAALLSETERTLSSVQNYYGQVLETTKDLKTSACTAAGAPHPEIRKIMRMVPKPVLEKFYGCGAPLPQGIEGLRVLDLGSGSGRDCYICSKLVGETGAPRPLTRKMLSCTLTPPAGAVQAIPMSHSLLLLALLARVSMRIAKLRHVASGGRGSKSWRGFITSCSTSSPAVSWSQLQ